jgi:cell wall assembly regulator SMI1
VFFLFYSFNSLTPGQNCKLNQLVTFVGGFTDGAVCMDLGGGEGLVAVANAEQTGLTWVSVDNNKERAK